MLKGRGLFIILSIVFSAGVTPIVIRITQGEGMPSLVIVLIRLWLISLALAPLIWTRYRRDLRRMTGRQWLLSGVAGFWLALNLLLLFASLEYTSVLMTSVLRRTTPMWIVLPEIFLFGVVFSRRFWVGLFATALGVAMVGLGGLSAIEAGSNPLLGAGMALFGSLCFGVYLLIGRRLSNEIPPLVYSFAVFLSAAVVASVFAFATGTEVLVYSASAYLWAFAVMVLAQVFGHTALNLALRHYTATAMAIVLQIAVALSAALALFMFGEMPTIAQIIGSGLVVYGVVVATVEQTQAKRMQASP